MQNLCLMRQFKSLENAALSEPLPHCGWSPSQGLCSSAGDFFFFLFLTQEGPGRRELGEGNTTSTAEGWVDSLLAPVSTLLSHDRLKLPQIWLWGEKTQNEVRGTGFMGCWAALGLTEQVKTNLSLKAAPPHSPGSLPDFPRLRMGVG